MLSPARAFAGVFLLASVAIASSPERVDVKIINRQNNETNYTYQIPGRSVAKSDGNANCYANGGNVSCNGSETTHTTATAPQDVAMHLSGATFTLLLPDGRIAVVNCDSKFQERFAGRGNRRSCRVPLMDSIQAEFKGDNAKLFWTVSLDGKKSESETYKIVAVVPAAAK